MTLQQSSNFHNPFKQTLSGENTWSIGRSAAKLPSLKTNSKRHVRPWDNWPFPKRKGIFPFQVYPVFEVAKTVPVLGSDWVGESQLYKKTKTHVFFCMFLCHLKWWWKVRASSQNAREIQVLGNDSDLLGSVFFFFFFFGTNAFQSTYFLAFGNFKRNFFLIGGSTSHGAVVFRWRLSVSIMLWYHIVVVVVVVVAAVVVVVVVVVLIILC